MDNLSTTIIPDNFSTEKNKNTQKKVLKNFFEYFENILHYGFFGYKKTLFLTKFSTVIHNCFNILLGFN